MLETEIPFQFPIQPNFLKSIYLVINELIKNENLKLETIRHTDYLEHYTFSQAIDVAIIKIYYNKEGVITKTAYLL